MKYLFVVRQGGKHVVVASVDEQLHWQGDKTVIANVQDELATRGLDLTKKADFQQIPVIFNGSYFWAVEDSEQQGGA